ncbi:MAG: DegV family protein [Oscillospiraceae bacterium]|nr:DegV family protein [Oscillospiraceae bacterium]
MIRIITDSAADFEPWQLEQLNISYIYLPVMLGEREYGEDLSKDGFYELLRDSSELPKTAQASPTILMEMFEEAKTQGDEAIFISLSSALSGSCQTALMSRELVDCDRCYVVDSLNATGGQRIIVEYAVKLRDEGKSAAEIVAALEQLRSRIELYACIDTLEYLYKGGRISHTTYKVGTFANIKPIITVEKNGQVGVPGKSLGMRKGMDYLCKRVTEKMPDSAYPLYVMYTDDRTVAEALVKRLAAVGIEVSDERIIQVGSVIGSHIGPHACGLVYVAE